MLVLAGAFGGMVAGVGCEGAGAAQRPNEAPPTEAVPTEAVPTEAVPTERPNVLVLVADDQRADLLGLVHPILETPHLDRLAQDGVRFENAFVTTSICAVSRASLLSGQYARRHGIRDFATGFDAAAWAQTYPALFEAAGYYTGFIGKYGLGGALPADRFDEWVGFGGQGSYRAQDADGSDVHLTELMGRQATRFLENAAAQDAPFMLSVSFKAPHVEDPNRFPNDPAFDALYADATIPHPPDTSYAALEPQALFRGNPREEGRARWRVRFRTDSLYQANVKRYYRLVNGIDAAVGAIRAALDSLGLADNTVVLYTSDNGFFLGEHGLAGKWYGHDASIRVPMLLVDPRRAGSGQVRDEAVLNIDVAPTLLDLAGLAVPDRMQGRPLGRLLDGSAGPWRADFFYEHLFGYDGRIPRTEGVVGTRYKYLRYLDTEPATEVLYDLVDDPTESVNVAGLPALQDTLAALRARWGVLRDSLR